MTDERIARERWTADCVRRIAHIDSDIDAIEARRIALDMWQVERLAAMAPETALDFVQRQLASDRPDKYERRGNPR